MWSTEAIEVFIKLFLQKSGRKNCFVERKVHLQLKIKIALEGSLHNSN
jgi:hypothetical protein